MTEAVLQSWATIKAIPNFQVVAGEIFFRKVFEIAPGAESMWRFGTKAGDPEAMYQSPLFKAHAEGLFNTIDVAIGLAEHGELMSLSETLVDLGRKHVKYGVLSDHYTIVGQALMHTLKAALGDAFTGEVEYGWAQVYAIVSSGMEEGAFYQQIEFGDAEETPSTAASKVSNPGAPLA